MLKKNILCFVLSISSVSSIAPSIRSAAEKLARQKRENALEKWVDSTFARDTKTKRTIEQWRQEVFEQGEEEIQPLRNPFSMLNMPLSVQRRFSAKIIKRQALCAVGRGTEVLKKEVFSRQQVNDYFLRKCQKYLEERGQEEGSCNHSRWASELACVIGKYQEIVEQFSAGLISYEEYKQKEEALRGDWIVLNLKNFRISKKIKLDEQEEFVPEDEEELRLIWAAALGATKDRCQRLW